MDSRINPSCSWTQRQPVHGGYCRIILDNFYDRRGGWLDGLARLPWLHCYVQSVSFDSPGKTFVANASSSWGMLGGFWPVLNRIMTACIWMGIQTYWGGQAVKIILGAIIGPKYAFMKNTLPPSANVDTCSLVSFFIFLIIFCPMLLIPPEKLQWPLKVIIVKEHSRDSLLTSIDRICDDRLQYFWNAHLVCSNCWWRRLTHTCSFNGIRKRLILECGIRHTSDSRSLEWRYRRTIGFVVSNFSLT